MNPVRPIVIIAVITCVAGFVIGVNLPEKEDTRRWKMDRAAENGRPEAETGNTSKKDGQETVNNTVSVEKDAPLLAQESEPLETGLEATEIRTDLQENKNSAISMKVPPKEADPGVKKAAQRPEYGTHQQSDMKTKYNVTTNPNKTVSITKKDNTTSITIINRNPILRENTPFQQVISMNPNYSAIENTPQQHATSTVP